MSKHRLILYLIALAVLFSSCIGHRFYENRIKPTQAAKAIQSKAGKEIELTDRAILPRTETVRLRKGSILPEREVIGVHEEPDETIPAIPPDPDFPRLPRPLPSFFEYATKVYTSRQLGISIAELEVKIADGEIVIESGETSVTQLGDWIESVGGVGRAQALVEELGWPDSVPIDSVIIRSTFKAEPPPPPTVPLRSEPTMDDLPAIKASENETPETNSDDKASEQ